MVLTLFHTVAVYASDGPDDTDPRHYQFSPPHQPHWGETFPTILDAMPAIADTIIWGLAHLGGDFAVEYGQDEGTEQSVLHLHIVHTPNLGGDTHGTRL